jgi:hypothetical protein
MFTFDEKKLKWICDRSEELGTKITYRHSNRGEAYEPSYTFYTDGIIAGSEKARALSMRLIFNDPYTTLEQIATHLADCLLVTDESLFYKPGKNWAQGQHYFESSS